MENQKQISENNKLLAEFLGLSYCEKYKYEGWYTNHEHNYRICDFDGLKYHSDWNWLMEVVEKIKDINNEICKKEIDENAKSHNSLLVINTGLCNVDKLTVFYACVEFIKWYNENK